MGDGMVRGLMWSPVLAASHFFGNCVMMEEWNVTEEENVMGEENVKVW